MLKVLVLQNWYNLSDQEMEFQLTDRISFHHFVGSSDIPDFSTIWRFRERLNKSEMWEAVWNELQNQLDNKNLKIKKGHVKMSHFHGAHDFRRGIRKSKISDYTKSKISLSSPFQGGIPRISDS